VKHSEDGMVGIIESDTLNSIHPIRTRPWSDRFPDRMP
jgi:hypothetical protein